MKKEIETENENELAKVVPSEFSITLKGKKRTIKFGNLALAKIEQKYGSLDGFETTLQNELQKIPMKTVPWLLSICMKDREGIDDDYESVLDAMDESDLTIGEVMGVILAAINASLSNFGGKKKAEATA